MNPDQAQNTDEPSLEESIRAVMKDVPSPVRSYLLSKEYSRVAQRLMGKYQLHIDQAAILEREIMLLIIGLETPEEFLGAMTSEASMPDTTARSIMGDLNQEVFIPLRDQLRQGTTGTIPNKETVRPTQPLRPNVPSAGYIPPKPPLIVGQQPVLPVVQSSIQKPTIAPLPPKTTMPQATVSAPIRSGLPASTVPPGSFIPENRSPQAVSVQPQRQIPSLPTLPGAMPSIKVPVPMPIVSKPDSSTSLAGVISQAISKPSSPTVVPAPAQAPKPMPPPPPAAQSPRPTPPPSTSRSSDPYREPIE